MKLLKLELQNINSLKSDSPIVIDFEIDQFKDVGLYAITGSTGAGKTTILDAITIALYHQVPRFKRPNVKASLVDVVSYGAGKALSRVTFENGGERFEAHWSIRLVDKKGKRLTNFREEVRFKNLSNETILAEKKTEVKSVVEKVTQLNYDQFLRSVMLAQGDFASFLSAPSRDKATLLEQITGEDIYKKIGDSINKRKSEEEKKLEAIRSKINNLDLLTTEEEEKLLSETKSVELLIKTLDKQIESSSERKEWFDRQKTLLLNKSKLEKDFILLNQVKEEKRELIQKLKAHKKAEPYKELILSLERTENEIQERKDTLKALSSEIEVLNPALINQQKKKDTCKSISEKASQHFKEWLPKLEEVSGLDVGIKATKEENTKLEHEVKTLNQTIVSIADEIHLNSVKIEEQKVDLDLIKQTLEKQKIIPEIEKEFNSWSVQLAERKNSLKELKDDSDSLETKLNELTKTKKETDLVNQHLTLETTKLDTLKEELKTITDQLKTHSFDPLLKEKEDLSIQKVGWEKMESLAQLFEEQTVLLKETEIAKKESDAKEEKLKAEVKSFKQEIDTTNSSLKDAQKILSLEQNIHSLEEERQKLIEGEPCALCGSKEHPFVSKYHNPKLSESEKRVKEREEKLNTTTALLHKTEVKLASTRTFLEVQTRQITNFNNQLEKIKIEADELGLKVNLNDNKKISSQVEQLTKDFNVNSDLITEAQHHIELKDKKEKELQNQREVVNQLKNTLTELVTEKKIYLQDVDTKEVRLKELTTEINELERSLVSSFSIYGIQLPKPEQTEPFLEKVEKRITEYNENLQRQESLIHQISESTLTLKNEQEKLFEITNRCRATQNELKKDQERLSQLLTKRSNLLSTELSIDQKRTELQTIVDSTKTDLNLAETKLIELVNKLAVKKKESENSVNEISKLRDTWELENKQLSTKIAEGEFNSKDEVSSVLLSLEDETKIERIREKINNQSVSLHALKEKLDKDLAQQETSKNFKLTEEEVNFNLSEQQAQRKKQIKRLGEIGEKTKLNEQIKDRNKETVKEIKSQEKELKKWTDLIRLIGGSKDAFNTYVQRLTLQNLIHLANNHLSKLNKRYSLQMNKTFKAGEELNFNIIDHFQMDEVRYIDTSSGGEKFLISLALALGLSDLASHNVSIDSLFIDEGFGTLDNHTLESVISTLETLQSQGKTIGIISHVENLKERISTQIQVSKQQNGISTVEICG